MASSNPLSAIPAGIHPVNLASGLGEPSAESSKKRKRATNSVIGLRYNFKPGSITPDTPGALYTSNGAKTLKFDLVTGGQQVFEAREEQGKSRECVMIWDEESQTFTLHALSSTLHLTLNRSASSITPAAPGAQPTFTPTRTQPRKGSVTSSSSSSAVPLAEATAGVSSRKRPRPSMVDSTPSSEFPPTAANRPVRGGKTVPRKQPATPTAPAPSTVSSSAKGRGKAGAKKKLPPPPKSVPKTPDKKGKVKSVAIIEDSDEEAAAYDLEAEGKAEEEDEFALLLGASLANGPEEDAEGEDDDEDDYEEDDDGDAEALGGAKVVIDGDGSEWL